MYSRKRMHASNKKLILMRLKQREKKLTSTYSMLRWFRLNFPWFFLDDPSTYDLRKPKSYEQVKLSKNDVMSLAGYSTISRENTIFCDALCLSGVLCDKHWIDIMVILAKTNRLFAARSCFIVVVAIFQSFHIGKTNKNGNLSEYKR